MKPQDFAAIAATMADDYADKIDHLTIENDENAGTTRLEVTFREKPSPGGVVFSPSSFTQYQGGVL